MKDITMNQHIANSYIHELKNKKGCTNLGLGIHECTKEYGYRHKDCGLGCAKCFESKMIDFKTEKQRKGHREYITKRIDYNFRNK